MITQIKASSQIYVSYACFREKLKKIDYQPYAWLWRLKREGRAK